MGQETHATDLGTGPDAHATSDDRQLGDTHCNPGQEFNLDSPGSV